MSEGPCNCPPVPTVGQKTVETAKPMPPWRELGEQAQYCDVNSNQIIKKPLIGNQVASSAACARLCEQTKGCTCFHYCAAGSQSHTSECWIYERVADTPGQPQCKMNENWALLEPPEATIPAGPHICPRDMADSSASLRLLPSRFKLQNRRGKAVCASGLSLIHI